MLLVAVIIVYGTLFIAVQGLRWTIDDFKYLKQKWVVKRHTKKEG